jgi:hypothetical protein
MIPMYIQMACKFCKKPVEYLAEHAGKDQLNVYLCRGCQEPNHHTLYRQLYKKLQPGILLAESIQMDDYYLVRYHRPTSKDSKYNYSIIFKSIIGTLDSSPDMEPISLNKPVCEIDHILELPWHDIEAAKHKLDLYTTFS